jgi:DNA-binding CsgD family transcriptional regulator
MKHSAGRHACWFLLTAREREVAEQFARGLSYKEVALVLHIAPATVRNHLARIYDKLGLETKSALVRLLATQSAVVPRPDDLPAAGNPLQVGPSSSVTGR